MNMKARIKEESSWDFNGKPLPKQYLPQVFKWDFVLMATWTFPLRVVWAVIMFIWNILEFLGISNSKANWKIWVRVPFWRNVIFDYWHHREGDLFNRIPIYRAASPWNNDQQLRQSSRMQAQKIIDVYFEQCKVGLERDQIKKALARKKKKYINYNPHKKSSNT